MCTIMKNYFRFNLNLNLLLLIFVFVLFVKPCECGEEKKLMERRICEDFERSPNMSKVNKKKKVKSPQMQ